MADFEPDPTESQAAESRAAARRAAAGGAGFQPDVLGEDYEAITIDLADDAEGPVVVTVVRRRGPAPTGRAVLYVHGFVDYFYQTALADFHVDRGEAFYAVDLRKYGRSLREHQTPYRMHDVADYWPDLEAALGVIEADGHRHVVINAHSTGGLIVPMWLQHRLDAGEGLGPVDAMVLNSPFLQVREGRLVRTIGDAVVPFVARRRPLRAMPMTVPPLYGRSISSTAEGEWTFDLTWKPIAGVPTHLEWATGARRAQHRLHRGLTLPLPILVLCSDRTFRGRAFSDEIYRGDAVLDTDAIARWSWSLGTHVTCVRIPEGMHDLLLSRPGPRARVYAEMGRWLDAYAAGLPAVPDGPPPPLPDPPPPDPPIADPPMADAPGSPVPA